MKVVLNSSVLFSALLSASTATKELFQHARQGHFELCLSEAILQETAAALLRKLGEFDYSREQVIEFITLLNTVATVVIGDLPEIPPVCRDPDDDHVLAAALAAAAEVIVTGDADLLALGHYAGVRILSVRTWLDELRR